MKRFSTAVAVLALLASGAFADASEGALGAGVVSQSTQPGGYSSPLRFAMFLDRGWRILGPMNLGLELEGDATQLGSGNFALTSADFTQYPLASNQWGSFVGSGASVTKLSLFDWDFSPRIFVSLTALKYLQLMGFAGVNLDVQTIQYTITNTSGAPLQSPAGATLAPGASVTTQSSLPAIWSPVVGMRLRVWVLYFEYTRLASAGAQGLDLNSWDKSRMGAGLSLSF